MNQKFAVHTPTDEIISLSFNDGFATVNLFEIQGLFYRETIASFDADKARGYVDIFLQGGQKMSVPVTRSMALKIESIRREHRNRLKSKADTDNDLANIDWTKIEGGPDDS